MKKRYRGNVVSDRYPNYVGRKGAWYGEHCVVYGPMECQKRRYLIPVYYPRWKYFFKLLTDWRFVFPSFIIPGYFLKATSYSDIVRGIMVLDDKGHGIPRNEDLFHQLAIIVLVWIHIYITPFLPPKIWRLFELKLKFIEKIVEKCRDRKYPKGQNVFDKIYFEKLKEADTQVLSHWEMLKEHVPTLKLLGKLFVAMSDNPSDTNARQLGATAGRVKLQVRNIAEWCDKRAGTWPDFVDAFTSYRTIQEEKLSMIRKYGPRTIFDGLLGVILNTVSGFPVPISIAFSAAADIGLSYLRGLILVPKWQEKSLRKAAVAYRKVESRIDRFLERYNFQIPDGFIREP